MKEFFLTLAIVLTLGCGASLMMHACSPVPVEVKAAAYGAELAKCRADAGAWQEYELCKAAAQQRFGVRP